MVFYDIVRLYSAVRHCVTLLCNLLYLMALNGTICHFMSLYGTVWPSMADYGT